MSYATSVVTQARYAQGLTYAEFLAGAKVNVDRFEEYYRTSSLTKDDLAFFAKAAALAHGPRKILALAEAWCGDVYRELPTIVRIAEATGMTLRIFLRDQNPDIMDEFLSNDGRSRAIPVFVFYSHDHRYITHFTERSAGAHAELASVLNSIRSQMNLPSSTSVATVPDAQRAEFIQEIVARILPRFPEWQKQAVAEMRQLLSTALSISSTEATPA
jgi:hypothetical protein